MARIIQTVFSVLPFAFGLLHLLLFLFFRRARENLYFAIYLFLISVTTYLDYQSALETRVESTLLYLRLHRAFLPFVIIFLLRFVYSLFEEKLPVQFWILILGVVATGAAAVYRPVDYFAYLNVMTLAIVVEITRETVQGIRRKREGAWIIAVGLSAQWIFGLYDWLLDLHLMMPVSDIQNAYFWGTLSLIFSMSVFLARDFARHRETLERYSRELEGYSQTLEQKVTERTQEIKEKNENLERALAELREAQNRLIMQEKMASLGSLVAGLSHELNTPIGAINSTHDTLTRAINRLKGMLETTCFQKEEDNQGIQAVFQVVADANQVITAATERVTSLVHSLQRFVRLDETEWQLADLHEGIESTLTLLHSQMQDEVTLVKNYGEIVRLYCSPGQLNQVFMHFLRRAVQSTRGNGEIKITTFVRDSRIYVQIHDTGTGIPPERLERIFDVGFGATDSRVGMELGWATAHNIVEAHQGEIEIESDLGKGTEVTISLPVRTRGVE